MIKLRLLTVYTLPRVLACWCHYNQTNGYRANVTNRTSLSPDSSCIENYRPRDEEMQRRKDATSPSSMPLPQPPAPESAARSLARQLGFGTGNGQERTVKAAAGNPPRTVLDSTSRARTPRQRIAQTRARTRTATEHGQERNTERAGMDKSRSGGRAVLPPPNLRRHRWTHIGLNH